METKNKNALIGGLLAVVFVMAVGYAAFATTLNINGTANITSSWDVHIENIAVATDGIKGTASDVVYAAGTAEDGTRVIPNSDNKPSLDAQFKATLVAPGDSVTYDVTVKNGGTLPAKLSAIEFTQTEGNDAIADTTEGSTITDTRTIIYTYTGIAQDDTLAAGASKTFQVTVTYNPQITTQPAEDKLTSDLTMKLTYVQDTTQAGD